MRGADPISVAATRSGLGAAAATFGLLISAASARGQSCLADIGQDGHPLFGNPAIRASLEEVGGQYVQDATSVALGDLDGDGAKDAVLAVNCGTLDGTQPYLYICFNQGDGVFQTPGVTYAAGSEPCAVEVADFDGDGDIDIAAANANGDNQGTISILLNNDKGVFAPDVENPVGLQPRSIKIADVNGDKIADLTVLNVVSNDVSILLGAGNGTFAPEVRYFVGNVTERGLLPLNFPYPGPFHAAADLEGDGDVDLIIPCNSQMRLLINDGAGKFVLSGAPAKVAEGAAYSIAAGDMTGDGKPDLAAACISALAGIKALSVALNKGDGSFEPPVGYDVFTKFKTTIQYTNSAALGDVDGDGDLDVAVGHEAGTAITLMRNNGNGTLAPKEIVQAFGKPWFVRWADVNGDGRQDLAVLSSSLRSKLTVMLTGAKGLVTHEFNRPGIEEWPWVGPKWLIASDFDDDDDPDVAVAVQAPEDPGSIIVVRNDGGDILNTGTAYPLGAPGHSSPEFIVAGDITGDDFPDVLTGTAGKAGAYNGPGMVQVLPGVGRGLFGAVHSYPLTGVIPLAAALGDIDGDGDLDAFVLASEPVPDPIQTRERSVVVLRNDAGTLNEWSRCPIANTPLMILGNIALADLDGDQDPDVAAVISNAPGNQGGLVLLRNDGAGVLSVIESHPMPYLATAVVLADLDGDGDQDASVLSRTDPAVEPYLVVLENDGDAQFTVTRVEIDPQQTQVRRAIGTDIDGDGWADLLITHSIGAVMVRLGDGKGYFKPGVFYSAGNEPLGLAAADFDGDGRMDIVTANNSYHNFSLLRGRACAKCPADCDGNGELDVDDFICFQTLFGMGDMQADCDNSGELDIDDFICFQTAFGMGCP